MKYLGLAYFTPEKFAAMASDDVKELVSQCPALDEKMRATGKVLISASLGDQDESGANAFSRQALALTGPGRNPWG